MEDITYNHQFFTAFCTRVAPTLLPLYYVNCPPVEDKIKTDSFLVVYLYFLTAKATTPARMILNDLNFITADFFFSQVPSSVSDVLCCRLAIYSYLYFEKLYDQVANLSFFSVASAPLAS